MKAPPCFEDPETKKIIAQICNKHGIDAALLKDLCELMSEYSGSGRRFGLDDQIAATINRFLSHREPQE
jgi:hypothetical protein